MSASRSGNPSALSSRPRTVDEIRATFIDFFKNKPGAGEGQGHVFVPSSPTVPHGDPTLLFANAGMNQFKPIFLGQAEPGSALSKMKRAVNSQKCIRAGGKHNDLEDVGKDTYHHTFFEMLGNWSFGDYFKAESLAWGFELLTKVYGISPDRLYATYFAGNPAQGLEPDHEARELWRQFLPASHVIPGGMKDNFWEMGDTGPCGPCSEIHFDRIGGRDAASLVNSGDPDVLEIWNHVFIQYNREQGGALKLLPAKHVDTGMGLERLVSVLQNVRSNYDTDVFAPLFVAIERITGARKPYTGKLGSADKDNTDTAYRVIADHIRTLSFAITDGAVPSNEGRGYVLRRILRRAVRYGSQMLSAKTGFMSELVPVLVDRMGGFFPELKVNPQAVMDVIRDEEESFGRTLTRGCVLFDQYCAETFKRTRLIPHLQMANAKVSASKDADGWTLAIHDADGHKLQAISKLTAITPEWADAYFSPTRTFSGDDAFTLFDTYGFPVDLTELMAGERGLRVDKARFEARMTEAKQLSQASSKFSAGGGMELPPDAIARLRHMGIEPTDDVDKFHGRDVRATVKAIWDGNDFEESANTTTAGTRLLGVVLDRSNFYAEMGGQVADVGRMTVSREARSSAREDESSGAGEFRVEAVKSYAGFVLHIGRVSKREIRVGDDVVLAIDQQRRAATAGNHTATHLLNLALRTHLGAGVDQKGSQVAPDKLRFDFSHNKPVSPEELEKIEHDVADLVSRDLPVHTELVPLEKARTIPGVRAVFGEAYPDPVRVVSIGRDVKTLLTADQATGLATSTEFCGGTHVGSTGQIGGFALVTEEGIAKGVRRITGLTGVPAAAAHQAATEMSRRVATAARLDTAALAKEAKEIAQAIDSLGLPAAARAKLKNELNDLQDKVKSAGKLASAAFAQEVAAAAKAIADSPEYDQGSFIVTTIEAGSDRDAITAAVNTIRQRRPRSALMLLSPDHQAGKLNIVAAVPDALIKRGLNAGDWVKAASAACGGRGGGKPDLAQGGGTDLTKIKETLAAAKAHAFSKCPN